MKISPPGRFRDLHMLVDVEKQATNRGVHGMYLSPQVIDSARQEMEANYEQMVWKKEHRVQSFFGVRFSGLAVYGMILVLGATYIWLKYGTLEPFPKSPPHFTLTQWLRDQE